MPTILDALNAGAAPADLAHGLLEAAKVKPKKPAPPTRMTPGQKKDRANKEAKRWLGEFAKNSPKEYKMAVSHDKYKKAFMAGKSHTELKKIVNRLASTGALKASSVKAWQPGSKDWEGFAKGDDDRKTRLLKDWAKKNPHFQVMHDEHVAKMAKGTAKGKSSVIKDIKDAHADFATHEDENVRNAHADLIRKLDAGVDPGAAVKAFHKVHMKHVADKVQKELVTTTKAAPSSSPNSDAPSWSRMISPQYKGAGYTPGPAHLARQEWAAAGKDAQKDTHAERHGVMIKAMAEYGVHSAEGDDQLKAMWHVHPVALQAYHHFMATGNKAVFDKVMGDKFHKVETPKPAPAPAAAATPAEPVEIESRPRDGSFVASPAVMASVSAHREEVAKQKAAKQANTLAKKETATKAFEASGIKNPTANAKHAKAHAAFVRSNGSPEALAKLHKHIDDHFQGVYNRKLSVGRKAMAKVGITAHDILKNPEHLKALKAYAGTPDSASSVKSFRDHLSRHAVKAPPASTPAPKIDVDEISKKVEAALAGGHEGLKHGAEGSSNVATQKGLTPQPPAPASTHTPEQAKARKDSWLKSIVGWIKGRKGNKVQDSVDHDDAESLDEGAKSVAKTLIHAVHHPTMFQHPGAMAVHHHIHDFLDTLPKETQAKVSIAHNLKDQTTKVRAPKEICHALRDHMDLRGHDANLETVYHHHVDDYDKYLSVERKKARGWTDAHLKNWGDEHPDNAAYLEAHAHVSANIAKGAPADDAEKDHAYLHIDHITRAQQDAADAKGYQWERPKKYGVKGKGDSVAAQKVQWRKALENQRSKIVD